MSALVAVQADALEIEALADVRLADEYDGAQARGEVQGRGQPIKVGDGNLTLPTSKDLGLEKWQIHEARRVRNAELEAPGVVRSEGNRKPSEQVT